MAHRNFSATSARQIRQCCRVYQTIDVVERRGFSEWVASDWAIRADHGWVKHKPLRSWWNFYYTCDSPRAFLNLQVVSDLIAFASIIPLSQSFHYRPYCSALFPLTISFDVCTTIPFTDQSEYRFPDTCSPIAPRRTWKGKRDKQYIQTYM